MSSKSDVVSIVVGSTLRERGKAFVEAWKKAEADDAEGVTPDCEVVLSFESWAALSSVLSNERFKLLQRLHSQPAKNIKVLSESLDRNYRRVHDDVVILEQAGLIERSKSGIKTTADKIRTEISFA